MKKQNLSLKYKQIEDLEDDIYERMLKLLHRVLREIAQRPDAEDHGEKLSKCIKHFSKLMHIRYLQQKERQNSSIQIK